MNKTGLKEKVRKCFLLLQSRPFLILVLLTLVMSPRTTALRIMTTGFLVLCCVATAASAALRAGKSLRVVSRIGEFQSDHLTTKQMSGSTRTDGCQNCTCCIQTEASAFTCWMYRLAQTLLQACLSALFLVKMYFLSTFGEEGLFESVENSRVTQGPGLLVNKFRVSEVQARRQHAPAINLLGKKDYRGKHTGCAPGFPSSTDGACHHGKAIACTHGSPEISVAADCEIKPPLSHRFSQESEGRDVPDLEDCTTPSEEEEVCKSVLEATTENSFNVLDDVVMVSDVMLQSANVLKTATFCPSEDEHSIEKHQILPLEGCKQCKCTDPSKANANKFWGRCNCSRRADGKSAVITDAELQKAASEYYTLEGDVLWRKNDIHKQSNAPSVANSCDFCKQEGKLSQKFSVFSLKTRTQTNTIAQAPASSRIAHFFHYAKRPLEEGGLKEIECKSAEESIEDAVIDEELRAIARSDKRGESSNYMSTAGSFRDYAGTLRDMDSFWSEYDIAERREDGHGVGCCDNHVQACTLHSKSRSKVLQTDPLLSKASLIREQEIMDVLWQEYDDDKRQKQKMSGKVQKETAQKERAMAGVDSAGSFRDVVNEGETVNAVNLLHSDYVMKFNRTTGYSDNSCHFGCEKPGWAKARGYQRRRHFVGLCKLFREFGLKQCVQHSKVDN